MVSGEPESDRLDLPPEPGSVRRARSFVQRALERWGLDALVETATLLTSELATNVVLHARTAFAVVVTLQDDGDARVEVLDGSPVPPRRRHHDLDAATGRGVALVDALASSWGATPAPRLSGFAKGVYFVLPATSTAGSAWAGDWLSGL